jgi:hypothetical protein
MYREKTLKLLFYSVTILLMLSVAVSIWTKENILMSAMQSTYTDIKYQEGTWAGRIETIEQALETFYHNPIIGSGSSMIHGADDQLSNDARVDSYQADLGYIHWIKNYGAVGMIWLAALALMIARQSAINRRRYPEDSISIFAEYQLVQIAVGFITINYLGKPSGILIFCLSLALLFSGNRAKDVNSRNNGDVKV